MRRIARRTGCVQFWKIARPLHSVAMPRCVPITAGSEARKLANSHTDMHAQWSVPTAVTDPTCELPCRQRSGERAPSCCVCSSESRASCTCDPAATIAPTPSVSSAGVPPPLPPIRGTYFAAPFVITISEFAVSPAAERHLAVLVHDRLHRLRYLLELRAGHLRAEPVDVRGEELGDEAL